MKFLSRQLALLLIVTTVTMSVSPLFTPRAEAVGTINNIVPSSTSVALLQCANQNGVITDALGSVFSGIASSLSGEALSTSSAGTSSQGSVGGGSAAQTAAATIRASITNKDGATGAGGPDAVGSQTVEPGAGFVQLSNDQRATAAAGIKAAKQSECLKSLGAAMLHDLLAASTQSIVNWINTGFDGDPLFVQDPGLFFKGMADQQVYTFVAELNDPVKYPFGAEVGASLAEVYACKPYTDGDNNCFNNTAVFTLSTEIGDNWQDFYSDFSVGGWNGWLAATQNPYNNPIDFQFAASQEIEARINAQQSNIQEELRQNGGFLSLRKCIAYDDGSTAEGYLGGDYVTTHTSGGTYDASSFDYEYSYFGEVDNCKQYAVTTPGSVIADQLNIHLGASAQAVALGDEINTSIAAVFDALTNQLIEEGLASLDDGSVTVTQQTGGYGSNYISTNTIGSSWYVDPYAPADLHVLLRCTSAETGEAIANCVDQIELTENYLGALYESRDYLNNVLLDALITLDTHMPEPDLGWQARMQEVLLDKTTEINNMTKVEDLKLIIGPAIAAVAGIVAAIPGVGAVGSAIILGGAAIANIFINIFFANSDESVAAGKAQAVEVLNLRYQNELKRIQYDIDNNNLPSAFSARLERDKMIGYNETYNAYVDTISQQEQTLAILKQIEGDLGLTEETTDGTAGTRTIDVLRASYNSIAGNITNQDIIDSIATNQDLFEAELPLVQEADAAILADLALSPFGGLDYTVPANLTKFIGQASYTADIAYAIGDCTLTSKDQGGFCPVDKNNSPETASNGYTYDYDGDGDKARLQNYDPTRDNYEIVWNEWWSFAGAKGVSQVNGGTGVPFTDDQKREMVHTAVDFLRLYPNGFTTSSLRQNPYSIFYPYPIPPLTRSPWDYEKMYQHTDGGCLALKPIDLPYGTCSAPDPLLVYTTMNPTAFNTFDHVETEDEKSVDKEIFLNYFIDSYRNPEYNY